MIQRSVTSRDNANAGFSTALGTTGVTLELRTGAQPATCATADSGTVVVTMNLPSTPLGSSSSGVISKSGGTWSGVAAATGISQGTPGHYRLKASGGACVEQGVVAVACSLVTATTATPANGNVLTFASNPATAGFAVGMKVEGTGIPTTGEPVVIIAMTSTTITMSKASTAGVATGVTISGKGDITLDGGITSGQTVTVATYAQTAADA